VAVAVVSGLEVGEVAFAATAPVDALCLALLAVTLDALRLALAAAATLDPLSLAAAMTLGALRLLAAAASAVGFLAAALRLGVTAMAAALSSALVGLCRCRRGNRKCRNTGRENELPHLESPFGFQQERSCYGAVPLVMTLWEQSTALG
jgi:hypothetical protein